MKIISICPSNTELCAYLGIENQLIAVDDYSDWPESIAGLPRLGPDLSIDIDRVEELQPDLVLASLSVPGMEKNVRGLEERSIPHIVLNPQSLEDIADDLRIVGAAVGETQLAAEKAEEFLHIIEQFNKVSATIANKPSLYWEWWPKPLFSPGGVNWLSEISRLAGAYNLLEDIELASVQVAPEEVIKRNPDFICLAWVGVPEEKVRPALVKKREGWSAMDAVKNDNILILEEPLYCRPSPRLIEGLTKLARILHPEEYLSLKI
ncbi:cobalamin-binding protein [Peribacillus cavernae]|uniref:Cobalamin-binding protein n=1 Tax=Peribacillus cavernae TaxID=1674310 RepID=A0A3S0VV24_9BACI|nr:cobalamin-binding protein [Peribacillus cavernae]MDQ0219638.1 iron complex transport system substrate-binding protein [Peribacillus cavernae]RUQ25924.1 cobalamin-binding protein [Peribacillus cavernae]